MSVVCRNCGMLIYLPRPEPRDVELKYAYLSRACRRTACGPSDSPLERKRSKRMLDFLAPRVPLDSVKSILDFGGGDGHLMAAFRRRGMDCYVVDYNEMPVKGVRKLANTVDGLLSTVRFDLIVCSHVFEHLTQPRRVLTSLLSHLQPHGHIFIEVPLEIWRAPPLKDDPVTHINFFTPNSLHNLAVLSGATPQEVSMRGCLHPSGAVRHGIRMIAGPALESNEKGTGSLIRPDAQTFVNPGLGDAFSHFVQAPLNIPTALFAKVRGFLHNRLKRRARTASY